jgi:hypothetical protein
MYANQDIDISLFFQIMALRSPPGPEASQVILSSINSITFTLSKYFLLLLWKWRQCISPKNLCIDIKLQSVVTPRTTIQTWVCMRAYACVCVCGTLPKSMSTFETQVNCVPYLWQGLKTRIFQSLSCKIVYKVLCYECPDTVDSMCLSHLPIAGELLCSKTRKCSADSVIPHLNFII